MGEEILLKEEFVGSIVFDGWIDTEHLDGDPERDSPLVELKRMLGLQIDQYSLECEAHRHQIVLPLVGNHSLREVVNVKCSP